MPVKADLENALRDALRAHDEPRKRTLRMALAAIRNTEVDRRGTLDDAGVLSVLQKEVRSRQETATEAEQAGRPELAAQAREEIAILESYLPQPFSQEELERLARQAVAEVGATSPREMGQVMKVLMPRLQGRATGDQASQVVRKLLQ